MYQQQSLEEFLGTLAKYLQQKVSGTLFLIGKAGEWGKIIIESGVLISVGFQMKSGREALEGIGRLGEIQFEFHPTRKASAAGAQRVKPQLALEEFFGFFGKHYLATLAGMPPGVAPSAAPAPLFDMGRNAPGAAVRPKKVLVVDDSSLARKAASMPLLDAGYQVVEAHDGFEALGQLQNERPDLVILDLIMPGIDGYRVLQLIKGNKEFAGLPVIMLTSRDSLLDKIKGKMSSTDEYLTKPFVARELIELVDKYLRR